VALVMCFIVSSTSLASVPDDSIRDLI
jgi:hypothetical protein